MTAAARTKECDFTRSDSTPVLDAGKGPTVFELFPADTTYFAQPWMINFRVRNLDARVGQLRASGLDVTVDPEAYPNGRFARLHDPEGHPVESCEPKGGHRLRDCGSETGAL